MYKIERIDYGLNITLSGLFEEAEAKVYLDELSRLITEGPAPQGAIIDLRDVIPPDPVVLEIFNRGYQIVKKAGLKRLSAIIKSPTAKNQALQLAFLADTDEIVRVFNVSKTEDWEAFSHEWAAHGTEPIYDATFTTAHFFVGKHTTNSPNS
jgi:hypothetical protein